MKFFINSNATGYLRNLEAEFGESTNSIRQELNKLESTGLLTSFFRGNKKLFRANTSHPLFSDLHSILLKHIGVDQVIERIVKRLGNVESVHLAGDFAKGKDSNIIDLIIVGDVDSVYLMELSQKAEKIIKRKIRYLIMDIPEFQIMVSKNGNKDLLLLWNTLE